MGNKKDSSIGKEEIKKIEVKEVELRKIKIHLDKYVGIKKYTIYQVAAVKAKVNRHEMKTIEEWDETFKKILTKRVH